MSPLKEVKDMLIADKVQNSKDFAKYHRETHPRADELTQYFQNWLDKLGIDQVTYEKLITSLQLGFEEIPFEKLELKNY